MEISYLGIAVSMVGILVFLTFIYEPEYSLSKPVLKDLGLGAQLLYEGISFPSSFTVLNEDDILLLEKDTGKVRRIMDGRMLEEPLLDVNVATYAERGLLGIASNVNNNHTYVFLYYTETNSTDGSDVTNGIEPIGNRLYRYELLDNKLVDPRLLLDLPAVPGFNHVGGAITLGPDNNIYLTVGDVDHRTEAQNIEGSEGTDGTGGILRITQDGRPVKDPYTNGYILGDAFPLNLYYAYGIRNSFGIAFDPVTGNLWDTENGPNFGDEINLVEPGFNSGWTKIQGIWEPNGNDKGRIITEPNNLVSFNGKGNYSDPEFIWEYPVGPSELIFFNSSNFGSEYENDLFVGNVNEKALYHFELNGTRTGLDLHGSLEDRISEKPDDREDYILAEEMGRISDLEIGPDGNLYILSHEWSTDPSLRNGSLYKIAPVTVRDITSQDWIIEDFDTMATSLKMKIREGPTKDWGVISTDFLPVRHDITYRYSLSISAEDVNQLHSKVYYYDSNKTETESKFIFAGQDGTFDDTFVKELKTPADTKFIKLQVWVHPNPKSDSYYTLNNVGLEEEEAKSE